MQMFPLKLLSIMEYVLNLNLCFAYMEMKLLDRLDQTMKDLRKNWREWSS